MRQTAITSLIVFLCTAAGAVPSTAAKDSSNAIPEAKTTFTKSGTKRLVFEEQKIEGKIRRPQLVLIKADQRPEFSPMVMQSLGKTRDIATLVDQGLIEETPYKGAFQFKGTKISNIIP